MSDQPATPGQPEIDTVIVISLGVDEEPTPVRQGDHVSAIGLDGRDTTVRTVDEQTQERDDGQEFFCEAASNNHNPDRLDGFANLIKKIQDDGGQEAPSEIRITYGFPTQGVPGEVTRLEDISSTHLVLWKNPPASYANLHFPLIGFQLSPFWKNRMVERARTVQPGFEPIIYHAGTTNQMVVDQVINKLKVDALDEPLSRMFREEEVLAAGASFQVSLVRARHVSTFLDDDTRIPKKQWKAGDIIVVKRPMGSTDIATGSSHSHGIQKIQRTFINEIRILSHPPLRNHRHLVYLFGVAWDEGAYHDAVAGPRPVLVQEYARYGSLQEYLEKNQTPMSTKTDLACQILYGIHALHSCHVIHGDIKCDNILLSRDDSTASGLVAKLSDFGFSTILVDYASDDMAEIPGGSRQFRAPEVLQALEAGYTHLPVSVAIKADIYSYGLTVCTVALSGNDFFGALQSAVLDKLEIETPTSQDLSVWCKTDPDLGGVMCQFAKMATAEMPTSGHSELSMGTAIVKILQQDHTLRLPTALACLQALGTADIPVESSLPGTEADTGPLEASDRVSNPVNDLEEAPTRFLEGNDQLFFMNGKLYSIGVSESMVDPSMLRLPSARRAQILDDLLSSSMLIEKELISTTVQTFQDARRRARYAFLAYQIFTCYRLGCGALADQTKAQEYLRRSAELGYVLAISFIHMMSSRNDPLTQMQQPEAFIPAMCSLTSYGPRFGDYLWPLEMAIMRETSPDNYTKVVRQISLYGFPEFGELVDDEDGPDVIMNSDYQYVKLGSITLALRMVPLLSVSEFKQCLTENIFPSGGVNQHGETLLYMCCRVADTDKALMLLDTFEWAQREVVTPNKNGRTPLHWLWLVKPEDVRRLGDALIQHGAGLTVVDSFYYRPIDMALKARREDVVAYFLEHMVDPFRIPDNLGLNIQIMLTLMAYDDTSLLESYLVEQLPADSITKDMLLVSVFARNMDLRMCQLGGLRNGRLDFVFGTLKMRFGDDVAYQVALEALCPLLIGNGDSDVVDVILDTGALDRISSCNSGKSILLGATWLSVPNTFRRSLAIYQDWNAADAHEVLGVAIQYPGAGQRDIIGSLMDRLSTLGLARAAVNYIGPDSCAAGCSSNHAHSFYGSQFWNAIDESAFAIADLLEPYCATADDLPPTIFHLLSNPGREVLSQVEYLLNAPSRHRPYVCQPLLGATVLHVAIGSASAYTSQPQHQAVLEMLLEFYIGHESEPIDRIDSTGHTALAYAAGMRLSYAMALVLQWVADPAQRLPHPSSPTLFSLTAFDLAFRRFILDVEAMPAGTGRVTYFHESTRHPLREARAETRQRAGAMVDVLALLCRPWQEFPQGLLAADDAGKKPDFDVRGLVPLTEIGNTSFRPAEWKGAAGALGLFAWAHLAEGTLEYWVNILELSCVGGPEMAALRADMYKKRKGETKWYFTTERYFCRLVSVDHGDAGGDPKAGDGEEEVDLLAEGISIILDGQVIDDSISGARVVGERVFYGHKSDGTSRAGADVGSEGLVQAESTRVSEMKRLSM